ncbi:AAA family ATPase [Flavobacterium denitrificans]|uniref:AAA family ATPase n=1 Tax=Flavobacterium denitrificans TaxID=281361 RepID=UPI0004273363|nr:AAA family ATPase [Flavobacterium denitrificans]
MQNTSNLNINIENFRAVNKAEISIDGITVIAGENGSGKSTISKLVYYLYKTITNIDGIISEGLNHELENIYTFLRISINDLLNKKNDRLLRNELQNELSIIKREFEYGRLSSNNIDRLIDIITKIQISSNFDFEENVDIQVINRLKYIVNDITKKSFANVNRTSELFEIVKEHVDELFKEATGFKKSRSTTIFKNELINIFHDDNLPKKFSVSEFGQEIVSFTKNNLAIPYIIQDVIYIDTPMLLGVETLENNHWEDLNNIIRDFDGSSHNKNFFSDIIRDEILDGEANYDSNFLANNSYTFKTKEGTVYDLLDCATGVKSFSIIQLLLKNGVISNKTLLIIDEPESHLHPQWIIEYARLIVLMNKFIGTKFLIASHNPDMVSAIKYISEKEEISQNLNYYLAEKIKPSSYNFIPLAQDIDPIFASFNIALDRMDLYGNSDEIL